MAIRMVIVDIDDATLFREFCEASSYFVRYTTYAGSKYIYRADISEEVWDELVEKTDRWAESEKLYRFNVEYNDGMSIIPSVMYTRFLATFTGSLPNQFLELRENMKTVANQVLQQAYAEGKLEVPGVICWGEFDSHPYDYLSHWEMHLGSLPMYAVADWQDRWDEYPRKADSLLLKFGDYEKEFEVNSTAFYPRSTALRSEATIRNSLINQVSQWGTIRLILLQQFNVDHDSKLVQELIKPEFWEKFVLPQLSSNWLEVRQTFLNSPIQDTHFLTRRFVQALFNQERKELEAKQQELETNRQVIENYIRDITTAKLAMAKLEKQIAEKRVSLSSEKGMKIKLSQQLEELQRHKYVKAVNITDILEVVTTEIYIDNVVPLGPYAIQLTVGESPNIAIFSDNSRNGFDHPHVNHHSPCWGNYSDVYVHLANLDLVSTCEIIFRFLESWNPEDTYGKNLIWWDAKYAFETLEEMELMDTVDSEWDEYYYDLYGSHLSNNSCEYCGEHPDDCCCYCPRCGDLIDGYCDCNRCENCGELHERNYSDCYCERCEECDALLDDCECDMCEYCGYRIEDCECDHCEECGSNVNDCCCNEYAEAEY